VERLIRKVAASVVVALVAMHGPTIGAALPADDIVSLGVAGRSNATPWVAASGSFVAVAWGGAADGKTDVFVAVSRDGARSFGAPVRVNTTAGEARLSGEMPPRVALHARSGSVDPEIVVLWTARGPATEIKTARSVDGGRTFTTVVTRQSSASPGDRGWPALSLDSRGTAHAIWLDHRGLARPAAETPHQHKHGANTDGAATAQKSGLYYAPFGGTAAAERALTMGVCYCCKTTLVVRASGELFAAWRHVYPGNLRDIAFTASRDGGRSFSEPLRVSEDDWAINGCPDDGPAMAVDSADTIHIVWPTVVGGGTPEGALFYASSRDGRAFSPRVRIPTLGSPKPSHPQIAIDNRQRLVVAWDEAVNGQRVAVTRELRPNGGDRLSFGEPITLSAPGPGVYPVMSAAGDGLVAVWTAGTAP
jgi:hypothetical protein